LWGRCCYCNFITKIFFTGETTTTQNNFPKGMVLNHIRNTAVTAVTGRVGEKLQKWINFKFFVSFFFMTVYSFAFDN